MCRAKTALKSASVPNRRAADKGRAFEGVADLSVPELPRNGGEESVFGEHGAVAGVEQHKSAGTVGILYASRLKTALTEQRSLLIPRGTRDRDIAAEHFCVAYHTRGGYNFRHH